MEGSTKMMMMMDVVGSMNVALNTAMEHYFSRAGELFPEEMKETPLLKAALKMHLRRQRENLRNKNKRKVLTMKGTKSPFLDFQEIYVVGKPNSDGAYTIELGPYVGDISIKSFKFLEIRMFLKKPTAVAVASCNYQPGDYFPELGISLGERLFLFGEADERGFFVAEKQNGQKGYVREEDIQEISNDINGEQSFTETGNVYEDVPNCYFANEKDMEEKKKSDDWMKMEEERMKLLGLLRTRILELEEEEEEMKIKKIMEEKQKKGQEEEEDESSEESEDTSDDSDSSSDSEVDVDEKNEEKEEEEKPAPTEKIVFKRYFVTEKVIDMDEIFNKAMGTMKTRTSDETSFDEKETEEEMEMKKECEEVKEMTEEEEEVIEEDENSGNEVEETPERSDSGSSFEIIKDEKESLLETEIVEKTDSPRALAVLSNDEKISIILSNMSVKQAEELLDAVKQTAEDKLKQWKREEEEQKEILAEIMAQAVENEQRRVKEMEKEQESLKNVEETQEESDFERIEEEDNGEEDEEDEEVNEDIEDDLEKLSLDVSNCEMKEQLMAEIAEEVLLANNKLAEEEQEKKRVFAEKMDELIQMQEAVMNVSDNAERLKLLETIKESMSQEWFTGY